MGSDFSDGVVCAFLLCALAAIACHNRIRHSPKGPDFSTYLTSQFPGSDTRGDERTCEVVRLETTCITNDMRIEMGGRGVRSSSLPDIEMQATIRYE